MSIDFNQDRWQSLKTVHRQWWQRELRRPIIPIVLKDRAPTRPEPEVQFLTQATCNDLTIPADAVIDRIDYELSRNSY